MSITGIHHATVGIRDLRASRLFYEDLLGLSPIDRPDKPFDGQWYRAGVQQIHLIVAPTAPTPSVTDYPGTQRHIALTVSDLDTLKQRLESAGIACTASRSGRPVLFCSDPDGNVFELIGES